MGRRKLTRVLIESGCDRRVKNKQMDWLDRLEQEQRTDSRFNTLFFIEGDSREPELAASAETLAGR